MKNIFQLKDLNKDIKNNKANLCNIFFILRLKLDD